MKSFAFALASAAVVSLSRAQYAIDPDSVSQSTRDFWCQQQKTQCPLICLQVTDGASSSTEDNDCYPDVLQYTCVCENGMSPNVSEYSQTLPYFICTEWGNQCVSNCGSSSSCANDCRANHPCGAQDPRRYNTTSTSPGSATHTGGPTTTGDGSGSAGAHTDASGETIYTGWAGSQQTGDGGSNAAQDGGDGNGAAGLREFVPVGGLLTVVGGLFAGFAMFL